MSNLLNSLKAKLVAWANNASMEDLARLPEEIFFGHKNTAPTQTKIAEKGSNTPKIRKRNRIRKHAHVPMNREEADLTRERLAQFQKDSPEFLKERDMIAREKGFSRRQISAAFNGLERAKKRKQTLKKK